MSEVRVNNIVDYGGKGAPTFDNGAVISGVSSLGNQAKIGSNVTITSGGINVSGVTTAATLSGNLTGDVNTGFVTATSAVIGSGVTINAGGLNITGVMTATTFEGDGSSMTGVAMTIAPLAYNPDVNDSVITTTSGIGITFDHRILAGSGNITLSIATNAGAAGTVVENFGVGSSVTIQGRKAIIDPTNNLNNDETYHINYPSGCFTNTSGDVDYVGTAYTFGTKSLQVQLFALGDGTYGGTGQNNRTSYSSPVQIPGTIWSPTKGELMDTGADMSLLTRTDGTLWGLGIDYDGNLGQNKSGSAAYCSSPVQIPGTTWTTSIGGNLHSLAIKTDGTLWAWGRGDYGQLGQNDRTKRSSPIQIPGTTWDYVNGDAQHAFGKKTDGTLWAWGNNEDGSFGNNETAVNRSSPVQVPGTWSGMKGLSCNSHNTAAIKSDGTLWAWGRNAHGQLGQNDVVYRSSPVQIPGTTWKEVRNINSTGVIAIKTNGTLWTWGSNENGIQGLNQGDIKYSSPVQVGSDTDWDKIGSSRNNGVAIKTDSTLWVWGSNDTGQLGQNNRTKYSSPVQIPGEWNAYSSSYQGFGAVVYAIKKV